MRKRNQSVEYKETSVFELFPSFEYTRKQKTRCIFFHDYAYHIKRIIRYASNFDALDKICLVYIVGEPDSKKIMNTLEECGCSDRVWVLTSPFPKEKLDFYNQFDKLRFRLNKAYWDYDSQTLKQNYLEEHLKLKKALPQLYGEKDYDRWCSLYREQEEELEMIHQYRRLVKASRNTYFKKFTLYRIGHLPKPFTHDRLDEYIKKTYPYGVESCEIGDFCALSPASVERGIAFAESGSKDKRIDFDVGDDTPAVKAIRKLLNKELDEHGFCRIDEIRNLTKAPPFGFGMNAYSAACLVYALKKYENRTLFLYDGVNDFLVKDSMNGLVYTIYDDTTSRIRKRQYNHDTSCLYLESHPHKVIKKILSVLFDAKIIVPGHDMATNIRVNLEKDRRYPLSAVDKRLYNLVSIETKWYDRDAMQALCEETEPHIEDLLKALTLYYDIDSGLSDEQRRMYPSAASWLWKCNHLEGHI